MGTNLNQIEMSYPFCSYLKNKFVNQLQKNIKIKTFKLIISISRDRLSVGSIEKMHYVKMCIIFNTYKY